VREGYCFHLYSSKQESSLGLAVQLAP
jgi:hypothetical protein